MFSRAIALIALYLLHVSGTTIVSPEKNATVVAGRTFTVEWDDTGNNTKYAIDLFHGRSDFGTSCGTFVTMMCKQDEGCVDRSGDYDVVIPAPLQYLPQSGYVIGVKGSNDDVYACSDEFRIITEEEVSVTSEYSLNVTAPLDGDIAVAGHEYTLQWKYLNGVGSAADRFDIDLYSATGRSGQCGTYTEALCDKSMIGCRDRDGEYLFTIPHDVALGEYRIRVGRFEDESIFDCSGVFHIVADETEGPSYSIEFSSSFSYY